MDNTLDLTLQDNNMSFEELDEETDYEYFVENIIPSLKFGDIIYAKRYDFEYEKENMGEGHDTGPFVVLSTVGDKIIGAYCTSSNIIGSFQIGENYELFHRNKKSYVLLTYNKTITASTYLGKNINSLSENDINKIKKKMLFSMRDIKYDDFGSIKRFEIDFSIDFEVGDVIFYLGKCYLIMDINGDKFTLIPIINYDSRYSNIDFSKLKFNYADTIIINKSNFNYCNSINRRQMTVIIKYYSDYLRKLKILTNAENCFLDRGFLIEMSGELYYIYGIEGNIANSFRVKEINFFDEFIMISKRKYIPFYENTKNIDIEHDTYKVLAIADETEMDMIKESRKTYSKRKKKLENIKESNSNNFLVCLKDNTTCRYIICDESDTMYSLISISSLLNDCKLFVFYLPKEELKTLNNITAYELGKIKRFLPLCNNKLLPKKLVRKIILNL